MNLSIGQHLNFLGRRLSQRILALQPDVEIVFTPYRKNYLLSTTIAALKVLGLDPKGGTLTFMDKNPVVIGVRDLSKKVTVVVTDKTDNQETELIATLIHLRFFGAEVKHVFAVFSDLDRASLESPFSSAQIIAASQRVAIHSLFDEDSFEMPGEIIGHNRFFGVPSLQNIKQLTLGSNLTQKKELLLKLSFAGQAIRLVNRVSIGAMDRSFPFEIDFNRMREEREVATIGEMFVQLMGSLNIPQRIDYIYMSDRVNSKFSKAIISLLQMKGLDPLILRSKKETYSNFPKKMDSPTLKGKRVIIVESNTLLGGKEINRVIVDLKNLGATVLAVLSTFDRLEKVGVFCPFSPSQMISAEHRIPTASLITVKDLQKYLATRDFAAKRALDSYFLKWKAPDLEPKNFSK